MKQMKELSTGSPSERGQAIILIIFSILGLFGMAALVIDGGNAYLERRKAQTAADAAALTAAITRIEGGDWREAALASGKSNGYDNNGTTNTIELNTPPIDGPYSDNPEYIQVIVTSYLDTYFGSVIGVPQIKVVAHSISQSKPAVYGQMFTGYALVSLAPHSECDKRRSFLIHGEATIRLWGGGLFVNSDNPDCAVIQYGSGSVRVVDDSPVTIVGGASIQKPQLMTPFPPQTGAVPIPYPPPIQMPKVGCGSKIAKVDEETMIMSPGNWDHDFPPEGVEELEAGVYCIGGNVNVVDRLIGSNVILVVEHGSVRFNSQATIQLEAPNAGPLKGLLLYMPLKNNSRLVLNGNPDSVFRGTILAPAADLHLNGNDSEFGFHSQIIAYYIEVAGQSDTLIRYLDEQNFDAFKMPEVLLIQ
jgi:hypothetical protein